MESRWIINVTENGKHFFKVEVKGHNEAEARRVFNHLIYKFPEEEFYEVTVTRWEASGTSVTW